MLLPFSTDIKVQQAQREQISIMSFLGGLPTEFETAMSQILASSEITSLNDVFSWVLRTESTPSNQQTKLEEKLMLKLLQHQQLNGWNSISPVSM
ncbi:hypothetical protein RDI58_005469 [Solanum bulbocastanum]|uniref:Uncharacterized protein n=1 Tax=Solanum bulbocastanum TaxID=147425 RepID=A0AAN8U8H1_SOLBU